MEPRDPLLEEWAAKILFVRRHHKLTQAAFARLLGVTGQSVSDWERGKTLPSRQYRWLLWRMHAEAEAAKVEENDGAAV